MRLELLAVVELGLTPKPPDTLCVLPGHYAKRSGSTLLLVLRVHPPHAIDSIAVFHPELQSKWWLQMRSD